MALSRTAIDTVARGTARVRDRTLDTVAEPFTQSIRQLTTDWLGELRPLFAGGQWSLAQARADGTLTEIRAVTEWLALQLVDTYVERLFAARRAAWLGGTAAVATAEELLLPSRRAQESEDPHLAALRNKIDQIVQASVPSSVRSLVHRVDFRPLGAVHGQYEHGVVIIDPRIADSAETFGTPPHQIDRLTQTVLHEWGHALGDASGADRDPEWLGLSGWQPAPLREADWDSAKHPREPAGSSAGGQFTSGGGQTDTPEFKAWFSDSKVVTQRGEPVIVYHGTSWDINTFDPTFRGLNVRQRNAQAAFAFASDPKIAEWYGEQAKELADLRYARAQDTIAKEIRWLTEHPDDLGAQLRLAKAKGVLKPTGVNLLPVYLKLTNPRVANWTKTNWSVDAIVTKARAEGRDGVIIRNIGAEERGLPPGTYYFVFAPNQIKSAISNKGTFDPKNPSIIEAAHAGECRYVEERPGWEPGPSPWVHADDAWFCRPYSAKSPADDFADCCLWLWAGWEAKFGERGAAKLEYVQRMVASAELREAGDWDEEKHPRAPAGQPEGGQFASAAGAAGLSRGEDKIWRDADGKAAPKAAQARLGTLRVPPAWTNVRLNADPNADLQVVGRDAKGRAQYLYSAAHSERAAAEKFARLKEFDAQLSALRGRIAADLDSREIPQVERDAAIVLTLIDRTGFRVGSDAETGAAVRAYGATTLESRHVTVRGASVTFAFTGKKGVSIEKTLEDKQLASLLSPRVKAGGRLFAVSDAQVRDYLRSRDGAFKVKDFRTWNGTSAALAAISRLPVPTSEKAFKAAQRSVAKTVAAHLGNTPAVALRSYIDPAVWSRWKAAQL